MAAKARTPFEQVYRAHAQAIYSYCLRRTTTMEAKDAAAAVFTVAWRRFDELPAQSPRPVARNEVMIDRSCPVLTDPWEVASAARLDRCQGCAA